ncbi:MAG: glutamine amidotransferase [Micropruina sp.]|uniref:glutamine amidotransferase n=1 Tax=Micropruina sp. TaxID=2737536 RepID=UPI0039E6D9D4
MKPFVLLATRDHDKAAGDEYESVRRHTGLAPSELIHIRVESGPLPELRLEDYSGVFLGGSPFNISDAVKSDLQLRVESDIRGVVDQIVDADFPFLGMCYGIGTVTAHLGGTVDRTYGEGLGAIEVTLTPEAAGDPLLVGVPASFFAFVGHKEACHGTPPEVTLLGTGEACPVQMYRYGENVYVTQFHPELDVASLEQRMSIYRNAGYFHPDDFEILVEMARASGVGEHPHRLLRNFVTRYATD